MEEGLIMKQLSGCDSTGSQSGLRRSEGAGLESVPEEKTGS